MPARLLYLMMLLPLCSWLSGCAPTEESQFEEQGNPHYRAGKAKLRAFDYKGAIEAFERALEENPRSALAHFELGVLYEQQEHDYAAALYHYNKVLKLRPSGYPSDSVRYRIPGCRQELIKADSLATISPASFNDIQLLRATNQWLMKELELTRAQLQARNFYSSSTNVGSFTGQNRRTPVSDPGVVAASSGDAGSRAGRGGLSAHQNSRNAPGSERSNRSYTVKPGDTLASISRQYGVRLESLQAANPTVNPRRLRVGQTLNIPAP